MIDLKCVSPARDQERERECPASPPATHTHCRKRNTKGRGGNKERRETQKQQKIIILKVDDSINIVLIYSINKLIIVMNRFIIVIC